MRTRKEAKIRVFVAKDGVVVYDKERSKIIAKVKAKKAGITSDYRRVLKKWIPIISGKMKAYKTRCYKVCDRCKTDCPGTFRACKTIVYVLKDGTVECDVVKPLCEACAYFRKNDSPKVEGKCTLHRQKDKSGDCPYYKIDVENLSYEKIGEVLSCQRYCDDYKKNCFERKSYFFKADGKVDCPNFVPNESYLKMTAHFINYDDWEKNSSNKNKLTTGEVKVKRAKKEESAKQRYWRIINARRNLVKKINYAGNKVFTDCYHENAYKLSKKAKKKFDLPFKKRKLKIWFGSHIKYKGKYCDELSHKEWKPIKEFLENIKKYEEALYLDKLCVVAPCVGKKEKRSIMMKKCPQCGAETPFDGKFCAGCGKRL